MRSGIRHGLEAALDAERFDQPVALANAGRVDQLHGDAADGGNFGDHIARGAGDVGDDGAVLLEQAIEQAALADVGAADDGQREAGMDQLP